MSTKAFSIVVVVVVAGCQDPRVGPLIERVAALEAKQSLVDVGRPPAAPIPPVTMSLLTRIAPTFPAPDYVVIELSDADRAAFARDTDGFRLRRVKQKDELLVLGHITVTAAPKVADSVLGASMNSFSVVVDTRAVDPQSRELKAQYFGQLQVMGISPEKAVDANAAKMQGLLGGLAQKLGAP